MSFKESIEQLLQPIILSNHQDGLLTRYELVKYLVALKVQLSNTSPLRSTQVNTALEKLISTGILKQIEALPIYKLVGHPAPSVQQVTCKLHPFSYLSHLSAMEWHHLTDRIPHSLHIVTCNASEFKQLASKLAATDMLKEPEYCGGIAHVLSVFEEHAAHYLSVIIKATERDGKPIDKVRMGYVLEERLGLSHPKIDSWKTLAQRGGSRVLITGQPFSETYSETWSLSINLPDGI